MINNTNDTNEILTASETAETTSETETFMPTDHLTYYPVGDGRVNLQTGKLTYFMEDMNIGGSALPYMLSHYYRNGKSTDEATPYGRGWTLSLDQKLDYVNEFPHIATYTNGKGEKNYFLYDDSYFVYDTSGQDLTFEVITSTGYIITDRRGGRLDFDTDGYLVKISDANGNYITITRNSDHIITGTVDSFGRTTMFNYTNGYLTSITDSSGRIFSYEYDTDSRLVKVIYPDGCTKEYSYIVEASSDESEIMYISYVKNITDIIYTFEYSEEKLCCFSQYAAGDNIETSIAQEYVDITYADNSATLCDRSGISKVIVMDDSGRITKEYEKITVEIDGVETVTHDKTIGTQIFRYTNSKRTSAITLNRNDDNSNFVKNGLFENGLDNWTCSVPTFYGIVSVSNVDGKNVLKFVNDSRVSSSTISVTQDIDKEELSFDCSRTLMFTGWIKSETSIPGSVPPLKVGVRVEYPEGYYNTYVDSFFDRNGNWGYVAIPIRVSNIEEMTGIELFMEFEHISTRPVTYYVDNIQLVNVPYEYTEYETDCSESAVIFGEEKRIREKLTYSNDIYTTLEEKDANYDAVRTTITDRDGNSFVSYAKYDDKHNLILSQNERGIMTAYTYNSVGNVTSVKTWYCAEMNPSTITEPTEYFLKTMSYDSTGEFLTEERDPRGDSIYTGNTYNKTKALLTSTTTPSGQTTSYTYDANNDLVTSVRLTVGSNEYSVLYGYDNRRLSKITHNGFDYDFTYDGMGRAKDVKIAGTTYSSSEYALSDTTTVTTTYATGEKMKVDTDCHGLPIKNTYTDKDNNTTVISECEYDSLGRLKKAIDNCNYINYNYKYDGFGNLLGVSRDASNKWDNTFDQNNRLTKVDIVSGNEEFTKSYSYETNSDGNTYPESVVIGVNHQNGLLVSNSQNDVYGRASEKVITNQENETVVTESYGYLSVDEGAGTRLTHIVNSISHKFGEGETDTLSYTYDNNGNITHVYQNNVPISKYTYDGMNQLVREDNAQLDRTYVYAYDTAGNILSKKEYSYSLNDITELLDEKQYEYSANGWKDKLISFAGQSITYNEIGNPTSYFGHTLKWNRVRHLEYFDDTWFDYDIFGKRTWKDTIFYGYEGDRLVRERRDNEILIYFHDVRGVCGFKYIPRNTTGGEKLYYYRKNLQGDILAIYDEGGTKVAGYSYDAWGKCTITSNIDGIADINPYRYRSYYYDIETGLYYLGSRYYDPDTGRFINADVYVATGQGFLGNNMFAYCENNPTSRVDENGYFWENILSAFIETVKQASGYFTVAAGVSQADSPIPGPADAISAGMILIGIIGCAGIAVYTVCSEPTIVIPLPSERKFGRNVSGQLQRVAERFKVGECVDAAKSLKKTNGDRGNIVQLYFPYAHNGYVCCDRYPNAISENGTHYGYLYEGTVWCNIYPEGRPFVEWINSFYDASGLPPIVNIL